MRTIALKLEFGVSHNQIFDRHDLSFTSLSLHSSFWIVIALFCHFPYIYSFVFSVFHIPVCSILLSELHFHAFDRTMAVHFTNPFHVSTRVADKCNDGTLLLQVYSLLDVLHFV